MNINQYLIDVKNNNDLISSLVRSWKTIDLLIIIQDIIISWLINN